MIKLLVALAYFYRIPLIMMFHSLLFFIYTTKLCTKCEYIIFMEYETVMTEHLRPNPFQTCDHVPIVCYVLAKAG